jgi:OmpA-OmpF porin, OOP family
MNKLNKIAVAVSVVCCSASFASHAQSSYYNNSSSWYIAPSVTVLDPDSRYGVDKNGLGGGLRIGRPISELWDIQLGGTYARSKENGRLYKQHTLGADALFMFSRESIRPFLLVGAGYERDKREVGSNKPVKLSPYLSGGAGLQLTLNDRWSMQADYRRVYGFLRTKAFGFDRSNNNYITIGLNYALDRPASRVAQAPSQPVPEVIVAAPQPTQQPATPVSPPPQPAPPRFEKYTLSATELFAFDSAELNLPQPKLDAIATALNGNPGVGNVVITGYADRIGSDKYNQDLSERRAMSVRNYLTSKGIAGNRLNASGRGEESPVVVCTDKNRPALIKCLEPNRRVEIEQITIERRL